MDADRETLFTLLGILSLMAAAWCFIEILIDVEARERAREGDRPGPNSRRK